MADVIMGLLVEVGLPIIGAVVSILVGLAVKKLNDWLDWKIFNEYKSDIEDLAFKAVMLSKKQVRQWAKEQGEDMDEESVVSGALEWLHKHSPELSQEDAREYVESALELVGLGGEDKDKSKDDSK